jgi:hypothetical protein
MPQRYQAFDPTAEVVGRSILGFVQCTQYDEIAPYLEKYGFAHVDPKSWYPMQTWLDVLTDIAAARTGMETMFDFVSIGMKLAEVVPLPAEYDKLPFNEALLATGAKGYQLNHRGNAGEQSVMLAGDKHIQVRIRCPYPDDMFYGFYYGLARRFMPRGSNFTVSYEDSTRRHDQGGEVTVLNITWK